MTNRDAQIIYERVKEGEGEAIMKKNSEMALEKQEVLELFWDERPEQLELGAEMTPRY